MFRRGLTWQRRPMAGRHWPQFGAEVGYAHASEGFGQAPHASRTG